MIQEKKERIFISYKRVDKERVFAIKDGIKKATGEECWIDINGIESDAQFMAKIMSAIERCDVFLFMLSIEHNRIVNLETDWTSLEFNYAVKKNKRIVVVNLDNSSMPNWVTFILPYKQVVDSTDQEKIDRLHSDLIEWLGIDTTKKTENKFPVFFSECEGPVIHIFFLIDCSGSMYGRRIEEVNYACSEVLRNLHIINPDVEIRINVLCFNNDVYWVVENVSIYDFFWQHLDVCGLSNFGGACVELNKKMYKDGLFAKCFALGRRVMNSLIILITDGEPTDDYLMPLQELQGNEFFKRSNRFAIGLGNEWNHSVLDQFAGKKKVFIIPDEEEKLGLKPMLERILHMGLYAGSCAMLDEE